MKKKVSLNIPPINVLLEGYRVQPWFRTRAEALHASENIFERVAAVGFVARLAAGTVDNPREVFAAMISGKLSNPTARAQEWAASIGSEVLDEVMRLFWESADLLRDDLRHLADMAADGEATAERAALAVCYQRDDLESVAWVLHSAGRSVADTLEAIDVLASSQLTALDLALNPDDDLLSTLAWQSPHAWWGATDGVKMENKKLANRLLVSACETGNLDMVRIALANGADPSTTTEPLSIAAECNDAPLAEILLAAGARVTPYDIHIARTKKFGSPRKGLVEVLEANYKFPGGTPPDYEEEKPKI